MPSKDIKEMNLNIGTQEDILEPCDDEDDDDAQLYENLDDEDDKKLDHKKLVQEFNLNKS